ncbi:MAG: hypothetical protein JWO06_2183 [Bacteroidota bacterium]|nr:hypothetical protein [Bacteroidota bacterium]
MFWMNEVKAICTPVYTFVNDTINCGDSITIGSKNYHLGGTYTDTLQTGTGCDSIVTLHLFAIGDTISDFNSLCAGDSFYFYGYWLYSPGEFDTILPGHGTCDTMASIFLAVRDPLPPHHTTDTICSTDSLYFAGIYLHASGVYSHIHCDSSVILTLTVLNADTTGFNQSVCGNDSFYFYGTYLKTSGTYIQTLSNQAGCDSFIVLHLSAGYDTINVFGGLCAGDSIYFYGTWIYQPIEFDTLLPGHGTCDTFASIVLAVIDPLPPHHIFDTICSNDSVLFLGAYLNASGTYSHIGCDSSVILNLTVLNVDTTSIAQSICGGDTFRLGNVAYTQSGNYFETLTNVFGCDSIISLALTINHLNVSFSWDSLMMLHDVFGNSGNDSAYYCFPPVTNSSYFLLVGGSPPGGHYSGRGVHNDSLDATQIFNSFPFDPDTIVYMVSDSNNCSQSAIGLLIHGLCEGINEVNANNSISIYPNPASTQLYIHAENFKPQELKLYDVSGQIVQQGKFEPQVNISQLSGGVYFIEVKTGDILVRKRFVKM